MATKPNKPIADRQEKISFGESFGIDVFQTQGKRPEQQDFYFVGEAALNAAEDPSEKLRKLFPTINKAIKKSIVKKDGGTTATIVMVYDGELICANLGDSPAYLFVRNKKTGAIETEIFLQNMWPEAKLSSSTMPGWEEILPRMAHMLRV